ncbi:MAG: ATP-binding cassette domain-containing protein [Myxococcales bacterium]|nr:ATP-binding cassette domain-containing protein [Myxococcales bacterium]
MSELVARGLRVVADDGRALVDGVDLELRAGAAIAVIGPSGAGKSTLARALVGLERGLAGSLRLDDAELVGAPPRAWRPLRRRVQLCWQDPLQALDPRLSARASINEARALAGLAPFGPADPDLAALVDSLGLDAASLERRPTMLSGGQRQRVALTRALAAEPAILIADEITSALDRPIAVEVIELLARRVAAGLGVLMITHDLSLLAGWIDEALVIDGGRVIERGPPERLLRAPAEPLTRRLGEAIQRLSAGR